MKSGKKRIKEKLKNMKERNLRLINEKEEIKSRWKEYFDGFFFF